MTKSSLHSYRQALEKLAEEPPTTKTALLRSLLPQIQLALRSGKTLKSCVDIVRGLMRTCRMTLVLVGYSYQRDSWQLGRQLLNI